jgi:limonene-1,2-epoxide hydrolase
MGVSRLPGAVCLLLVLVLNLAIAQARAGEPLQVVEQMVAAWDAADLDGVIDMFADDGVLHSMMAQPVQGRVALREHLAPLFEGLESLTLQLRNVVVSGNTVFLERVDEFVIRGKRGAVPVVGVLEVEQGKVKVWREYFDRNQLFTEMGLAAPGTALGD